MSFGGCARELAPYLDEPAQLPSGAFGKDALLRLAFEARGDRSILAFQERRAPLLVQKALYCDEGMPDLPCVFIISNSGGILQGDRYAMEFVVREGARGHITTQAATKIHEMDANHAAQSQRIILEEGAYLEYLPEPTIPFRHSRFLNQTEITVAPTATLLYSEILTGGRKYYGKGEVFEFDLFSSAMRAERPDGRELFVEKFLIEPRRLPVRQAGMMQQYDVFGNVILLTPKEHADCIFGRIQPILDRENELAAGISRLPNDAGLIYKVLARETQPVREKVREFWSVVRPVVVGASVPAEFPWR